MVAQSPTCLIFKLGDSRWWLQQPLYLHFFPRTPGRESLHPRVTLTIVAAAPAPIFASIIPEHEDAENCPSVLHEALRGRGGGAQRAGQCCVEELLYIYLGGCAYLSGRVGVAACLEGCGCWLLDRVYGDSHVRKTSDLRAITCMN